MKDTKIQSLLKDRLECKVCKRKHDPILVHDYKPIDKEKFIKLANKVSSQRRNNES